MRTFGLITILTVVAARVLLWAGRCRHRGKLGLLPPVTAADGSRISARWYCPDCRAEWPAGIDRVGTSKTIRKFDGYDQSKAPLAAAKAEQLNKRRTAAALERAGQMPRPGSTRKKPTPFPRRQVG